MKAGTRVHDSRALKQLALNVHVKHSDLTCTNVGVFFLLVTSNNYNEIAYYLFYTKKIKKFKMWFCFRIISNNAMRISQV